MPRSRLAPLVHAAAGAVVLLTACGGQSARLTAPAANTSIVGVSPVGGATSVALDAVFTLRFDHAVMATMQQFVALHRDGLRGPVVAGSFAWSSDRRQLTFTPDAPLAPRTTYVLHIGGGMRDSAGSPIDYAQCSAFGGQTVTAGMMGVGGMMGGGTMGAGGMMGPGWQGANGSYGMEFVFTTA